ncbi:dihydrofolate reductase family protein [Microbacterium azadirachtae]|uniref:Bacterial bifunctional deaminase-reductase C-terminal domain-containing protein n=1 Tax=Microbacterium azadirachtae TaxID=582680 RepID=A0A0F0LE17_9MICO|nr:dihydrofolate reductase [Microbacterium azadirachtae]KJL31462.1 hypothetical protein RS86_03585 [Microbacterium azadirachtae]
MTASRTWRGRAFLGMSLDGFIAAPGGDLSFLEAPRGRGLHTVTSADHPALVWETFFPEVDALVMGRATYEKVLTFGHWPYDGKRVVVLSSTLPVGTRGVKVVRSVEEAATTLDSDGADQVYIDGGRTVREFMAAGLLDELTVSVAPIVIGGGIRLFGEGDHADLIVRGSHVEADGFVRTTYKVLPIQ